MELALVRVSATLQTFILYLYDPTVTTRLTTSPRTVGHGLLIHIIQCPALLASALKRSRTSPKPVQFGGVLLLTWTGWSPFAGEYGSRNVSQWFCTALAVFKHDNKYQRIFEYLETLFANSKVSIICNTGAKLFQACTFSRMINARSRLNPCVKILRPLPKCSCSLTALHSSTRRSRVTGLQLETSTRLDTGSVNYCSPNSRRTYSWPGILRHTLLVHLLGRPYIIYHRTSCTTITRFCFWFSRHVNRVSHQHGIVVLFYLPITPLYKQHTR